MFHIYLLKNKIFCVLFLFGQLQREHLKGIKSGISEKNWKIQ